MSDIKKPKKRFWTLLLLVGMATLATVIWAAQHRQNDRHGRFYNAGKTINAFLGDYCHQLEAGLEIGSSQSMANHFSELYQAPGRGVWRFSEARDQSSAVSTQTLQAVGTADLTRTELLEDLQVYLDGVTSFEKTICKIDLVEALEPQQSARLTVKIILDGTAAGGEAFQDRFFYRWHLANEAEDGTYQWRIRQDELVEGIRVAGDRQALVAENPADLGIDFAHQRDPNLHMKQLRDELQFGVIQHASGGISAADYDRDGRPDLLFLDGVASRLYRNEGPSNEGPSAEAVDPEALSPGRLSTHFRDVTSEVGLDGLDRAHVGLFADFDNDGDRDLFVGRYLAPNRYYENVGVDGQVRFEERGEAMGLATVTPSTSATLLDFDLDGFLDIYLGVNGNAFEALPRLPFFARNGQPNRLFRNQGGQGFVDVTETSQTGDTGWTLAVATGDVNGDGYPDLAAANDFGRKTLFLNQQDGTFRDIAKDAGVLDFSGGMGLAFGDFDDDGQVDLYTSNINSNQRWFGEDMTVRQYIRNVSRTRWAFLDALEYVALYRLVGSAWVDLGQQIGEGNSLFRNLGAAAGQDGTSFEEIKDSHASRAGWGWSVAFFDLDNDTDLDVYAANGWISNQPGTDL